VRAASYGGFVGYNTQWDDAIIGIELNYNHSSLFGSWSSSRCYDETNLACFGAITLGDGNAYNATVVATTSARITDYGTLRGRGVWAYGNLLPYAFAGVALARAEVANAATVDATPTATSLGVAFVHTERDARTRFTWGYSLGVGIDFLVTPNVFLRGEYEYIKLNAVGGVELAINTARFGAGVKF
jgi:outer membrane immunogenic protein